MRSLLLLALVVPYAKQYLRPDGSWSLPQPSMVTPRPHAYGGPVAILVSGSTESAGETFTQAMHEGSPRPTLVGEPTQGVYSDTLDRPLPNGWTVTLPNERYLSSSGRSYDVTGQTPDLRAPFVYAGGTDPLFTRAYDLLTRR